MAPWRRRRDDPEAWLPRPEFLEPAVPSGRDPSRDGDERETADDARRSPPPPVAPPPPPTPAPCVNRLSIVIIETGRESERDDDDAGISEDAVVPAVACLVLAQVMVVESTSKWLGLPNSFPGGVWKAESMASAPRTSSRRQSTTTSARRASWAVPAWSSASTVWDTRDAMSSVSLLLPPRAETTA